MAEGQFDPRYSTEHSLVTTVQLCQWLRPPNQEKMLEDGRARHKVFACLLCREGMTTHTNRQASCGLGQQPFSTLSESFISPLCVLSSSHGPLKATTVIFHFFSSCLPTILTVTVVLCILRRFLPFLPS